MKDREEYRNRKKVSEKVQRLQQLLASKQYTPPLYVRFQTQERHHTLPVVAVLRTRDAVQVTDSKGKKVIFIYPDLVDIVAFEDVAGVPIFIG